MSKRQDGHELWDGRGTLMRIGLVAGAILASIALFGSLATSASAKEQVGVFLAGEESGEPAKQPRFEAEGYPAYLVGSGGGAHVFGFKGGNVTCAFAEFSSALSGASTSLKLATFYPFFACKGNSLFPITIQGNGCNEVVNVLNAGPPYVGEFGMECPAGQSFKFIMHFSKSSTCTISIPAQSGLTGVSFANTGAGAERAVDLDFEVSGLKYTLTGSPSIPGCSGTTHEDGTYTGSTTLEAFDEQ